MQHTSGSSWFRICTDISTMYILDYPDVVKCKSVLDIGSGCGASAIAAQMSGASQVVANDIDPVAEIAIRMNCLLNNVKPFPVFTSNIIGTHLRIWDLILLGDMFYDEELSESLQTWLKKYISVHETLVLIGDPGRPHFISHSIFKQLQKVAEYELPETTREQNYGLTRSCVWKYQP
ncbi:electron transfer flavoprotein beta subunit lysine methyltransferase isoform X2 [Protopterus annectens]|uniref:electron transfer flavoprotein beta subunit lysine methyltransferase isoform X2 n=1 Tax=Protopterus annectens TaxID=7888 RepID=UPI001CF94038|nr:electron transfer flavoprotein beta subunit lysine methyltransferase isoform X2 [Protopterus annectens]